MQTLARWSTKHRRLVVGLWLLCLVGSVGLASGLKNRFVNNVTLPNTDAQRATDLLKSRFPTLAGDSDQIVFRDSNGKLADLATRAKVTSTLAAVAKLPHVTGVVSPYANARALSRDGTIGFATVSFDERGDALPTNAVKRVIAVAQSASSSRLEVELGET